MRTQYYTAASLDGFLATEDGERGGDGRSG
ncbi:hypothetical protein EV699_105155 [Plasticicumulans lactativorans]|uniref:Uncharacterized protein n=1 Tax=Plasticicumulans lactativorans TaxID=1133106 RepID=A0A4R2LRT1_9GAMM|nr:hypothetical protein EV699_105155 [Plasticicumulans lactativorans]